MHDINCWHQILAVVDLHWIDIGVLTIDCMCKYSEILNLEITEFLKHTSLVAKRLTLNMVKPLSLPYVRRTSECWGIRLSEIHLPGSEIDLEAITEEISQNGIPHRRGFFKTKDGKKKQLQCVRLQTF